MVLAIEAPHVGLAGRAEDRAAGALGDLDADADEAGLELRAFAALVEPLERELAQERMEAEARLDLLDRGAIRAVRAAAPISIRTRLLSARDSRPVEDVDAEVAVGVRDGPGGVGASSRRRRPPAGAKSRRSSGASRSWLQAIGAAQRPLPLGQVARPAGEVEAPAEPLEDRRRAHEPDPGGGELDRQRQAVEALADRPDRGQRVLVEDEVRAMRPGAVLEQRDAGRRRRAAGPGGRAHRRSAAARGS